MKSGVKYGDLGNVGHHLLDQFDALQSGLIVQGSNCCNIFNCVLHLGGDERGRGELWASMNDAMSGNVDFGRRLKRCRWSAPQIFQHGRNRSSMVASFATAVN